MTVRLDVYTCKACGVILEVLNGGQGKLTCCGSPMTRLAARPADSTAQEHAVRVEQVPEGLKIDVGARPHPMTRAHHIGWIELHSAGKIYRQFLQPGEAPEATFSVFAADSVREYCNQHGLWQWPAEERATNPRARS